MNMTSSPTMREIAAKISEGCNFRIEIYMRMPILFDIQTHCTFHRNYKQNDAYQKPMNHRTDFTRIAKIDGFQFPF